MEFSIVCEMRGCNIGWTFDNSFASGCVYASTLYICTNNLVFMRWNRVTLNCNECKRNANTCCVKTQFCDICTFIYQMLPPLPRYYRIWVFCSHQSVSVWMYSYIHKFQVKTPIKKIYYNQNLLQLLLFFLLFYNAVAWGKSIVLVRNKWVLSRFPLRKTNAMFTLFFSQSFILYTIVKE